jgi:hypothetical protein
VKLKDARDFYYFHSGKTSDLIRQLGLAGIAIVWIFKYEVQGTPKIPEALALPLVLIVVGLVLDLLQYSVATAVWGTYQRLKERAGVSEDADFKAPRQFNWPALAFFWLKVVSIAAAYFLLIHHLAQTVV